MYEYCKGECGVQVALGKRMCRSCAAVQASKCEEVWEGYVLCKGGCGAQIKNTKSHCRACTPTSPAETAPTEGYKLCPGSGGGSDCPNSSHILLKNEFCKSCGESPKKRAFANFLVSSQHCECQGCSDCDEALWRQWLEGDGSLPDTSNIHCSRPVGKKNKEAHRCAFCPLGVRASLVAPKAEKTNGQ